MEYSVYDIVYFVSITCAGLYAMWHVVVDFKEK